MSVHGTRFICLLDPAKKPHENIITFAFRNCKKKREASRGTSWWRRSRSRFTTRRTTRYVELSVRSCTCSRSSPFISLSEQSQHIPPLYIISILFCLLDNWSARAKTKWVSKSIRTGLKRNLNCLMSALGVGGLGWDLTILLSNHITISTYYSTQFNQYIMYILITLFIRELRSKR